MSNDTGAATEASSINQRLMNQYAAVGAPALTQNLAYARGALAQGTPGYVNAAYQSARTGALESSAQGMTSARARLASNLSQVGGGGYLSGLGQVQASGAQALANETGHIATTQALTGLEQRNKLLNVMMGAGASGTNLSAGFGWLTNEGLGLSAGANSPYGPIVGGLSALTGIYGQYQMSKTPALGYSGPGQDRFGNTLYAPGGAT